MAPAPAARAAERSGARPQARTERLLFLSGLSLVVAATHAIAAVPHMAEYPLYGVLFVALASVQAAWGVSVYRHPDRRLIRFGIALNVGVVLVWVASRTVGLPLGPEGPGVPEAVGFSDLAATLDELGLIALAAGLLRPRPAGGSLRLAERQALLVLLILGGMGAMAVGHAH